MLIPQNAQWSKKKREAVVAATCKGGIEEYLSTTTTLKTTKDLQKVFSQLEHPPDSQYQQSILVEGLPGVGKTVLLKHIAYLWAQGELLTNTDFLFLLHLRDPSVREMQCLDDLVGYFYHYDKQACKVTSCIGEDGGKSVTVLLDGYDELPPNLRKRSFIVDLLEHRILPACSVVVSSRPHVTMHLRENINCQVEILGFSEEDQQHFIEESLKNQPDKIPVLKQYLKSHIAISSLCFMPFNMTTLLFLFKDKEDRPLPTTSTNLYKLFICLTIYTYLAKSQITLENEIKDLDSLPQPYQKTISQLSKFAFKALGNNQLVFTLVEIKKGCPDIDIDANFNGYGLLQTVEYAERASKCLSFNFIHLCIQEFLAAHYITTLQPKEELSILQDNFWNNPVYFNMFEIYVTLTSGQRPSFKRFLQPSLMEWIKQLFIGTQEGLAGISQQFLDDKIKCLRMYHCFQAAGDQQMCKAIEKATKVELEQQLDLRHTRLSPYDVKNLAVFLAYSSHKEWDKLNMWRCFIQDRGLQILQHVLRSSNVTITQLLLYDNNLTERSSSAISDLTISCRAKTLSVSNNETVGEDASLYRVISDDSSLLEELYMWSTKLSSRAAIELFTALSEAKKLKILEITKNDVTDEACDSIITAIKINTCLVKLCICSNPISAGCAQLIVQALQHNKTLQQLCLNRDYPHDIKEKIELLQGEVNKSREACENHVMLEIKYNEHFIYTQAPNFDLFR